MSSLYTRLWAHFLAHAPVRRWLFHPAHHPNAAPQRPLTHSAISRSLAFVCDFPVPPKLRASASSFALGELLVPVQTYGRFVLGFIVAASPHHKVAASVASYPSQTTIITRTVVVDPGVREDDPILLLDFAWLKDHSVIVAAKQLPPVNSDLPVTGVVAFYSHSNNLSRPYAVATFVENSRRFLLPSNGKLRQQEPPPEAALSVARLAAASQRTRHQLFSSDSDEALPALSTVAKRCYSIRAAGAVTVNIRIAQMAPDGRFLLANSASQREVFADFHIANDTQLTTLRQVASLSASFNQPNNTASTALLSSTSSSINNVTNVGNEPSFNVNNQPNNDTLDPNQSGQSVDILAALADAERATSTDTQVCSPPSNNSRPGHDFAATSRNNLDKYIECVSPPPPAVTNPSTAPSTLHSLPLPGALALPPSYTSIKSSHPIPQHPHPPPSATNVYAFDYSPVSYSAGSDALAAAVVNAADRVIDRSMFDKFFPATSNIQSTSSNTPPTAETVHTLNVPTHPQTTGNGLNVPPSSHSSSPPSISLDVSTAPSLQNLQSLPVAIHSQSLSTQSAPLGVHSQPLPTQSLPIAVHSTPLSAQSHGLGVHIPLPTQSQSITLPTASPTTAGMETTSRVTEVRATKRTRSGSGVCTECGKCFFKSGALARHVRYAHPAAPRTMQSAASNSEQERLDCPKCDKTFSQQGSLNRHLRSIHEARKLHCRYCTLAFGQAFDLKRHQRRKHPGRATAVPREALPAIVLRGRARAISAHPTSH